MVITLTFWMMGFLRMSTTGLVAQAIGENNKQRIIRLLLQSIVVALIMASLILLLQKPISYIVFSFQYPFPLLPLKSFSFKNILLWSVNFNTIGLMSLE
jgi:MATE family multidrug resistance protein